MLIRRTTKLALAALAALAVVGGGASGAEAATSCTFANDVVEVRMSEHGDAAGIVTESDTIAINGPGGRIRCAGGIPTTATTDTVLVVDESDNLATAAGGDGDTTVLIEEPATFRPGKTREGFDESSEIEFATDPRGGYDTLYVVGTGQRTLVAGNEGLSWTTDSWFGGVRPHQRAGWQRHGRGAVERELLRHRRQGRCGLPAGQRHSRRGPDRG